MNGMPLNDTNALFKVVNEVSDGKMNAPKLAGRTNNALKITNTMGSFWKGQLAIECENGKMANDTFLQLEGWTKGIAFVNGFNLGRYWPVMGPQVRTKCFIFEWYAYFVAQEICRFRFCTYIDSYSR